MPFGIITKAESGLVQVDSENPALALYTKRTIDTPSGEHIWTDDNMPDTQKGPLLLVFNPLDYPISHGGWKRDASNDTYKGPTFGQEPQGDSYSLTYAVFMLINKFSGEGNYGIRVYNANGDIVFRDDANSIKVVNVYTGTQNFGDSAHVSVNNADQNLFGVFPTPYKVKEVGSSPYRCLRTLRKKDSSTIEIKDSQLDPVLYSDSDIEWLSNFTLIEVEPPN
ncbi:MAG: hypothetical protein ACOCQ0_02850 [Desulfosalsimonas sp.]